MKALLLGGTAKVRQLVQKLVGKTATKLDWCQDLELLPLELSRYGMILVDGGTRACREQARLLEVVRRIRATIPALPILVLSSLEAEAEADSDSAFISRSSCGTTRAPDGMMFSKCRLRELAYSETAAVLLDEVKREPFEPIRFEYNG